MEDKRIEKWYRKKGKREREVSFYNLELVKKTLKYTWAEVCSLMGLDSTAQVPFYRASNGVPFKRFNALKEALLLRVEQKRAEERKQILDLFNLEE